MKKPWRYHGECCASRGPAANTLAACGPSGFGLGTSPGTTFTMLPPWLFQIMSQSWNKFCVLALFKSLRRPPRCSKLTILLKRLGECPIMLPMLRLISQGSRLLFLTWQQRNFAPQGESSYNPRVSTCHGLLVKCVPFSFKSYWWPNYNVNHAVTCCWRMVKNFPQ